VTSGARGALEPPLGSVREAVARALEEDLAPLGDITAALVPERSRGLGRVVAREEGVLAGTLCMLESFRAVDSSVSVDSVLCDGSRLHPGAEIARIEGPLRPLLSAERTALNFLCHLSGVATLTRRFVDAVEAARPGTRVLDTRKTTPGLRALEKAAVRAGGGRNHRGSLSEGILVKDNHLVALGTAQAVERARVAWPGRMVEVECDTLAQVREAVEAGAPMVLLDNMEPAEVEECVKTARAAGSGALFEVSGGVTLETAPAYAAAGADFVSVGALTHSAPALDIGLDVGARGAARH
jgi:nicotinate-nucleotide pyrophosphorylase (carboxylating)